MIVRMPNEWEAIREAFSQEEKERLNAAISGETICPRGIVMDLSKLDPQLQAKFTNAIETVREETDRKAGK